MVAKEAKYPTIVGGFNKSETYARQIGAFPQGSGWTYPKQYLKPPTRFCGCQRRKNYYPTGRLLIFGTRSTTSHDDRLAVVSPRVCLAVEDTQSGVLWPNAKGRVGKFQHVMSCWEVTLQRICPWNPQWFMGAKISLEVKKVQFLLNGIPQTLLF